MAGFSLNSIRTREVTDEQIEALKSVRSIVQSVGFDEEEIGMIVALRKFLTVAEARADFFNKFE